jgi:hypothetical protein
LDTFLVAGYGGEPHVVLRGNRGSARRLRIPEQVRHVRKVDIDNFAEYVFAARRSAGAEYRRMAQTLEATEGRPLPL